MGNLRHIKKITPYQDINNVLYFLAEGIRNIFGDNLVGMYLTGSLSYGDFNKKRSDIDLVVVLKKPASSKKIKMIKRLHLDAERKYKKWSKKIECSYIPLDMLQNILPPKTPRPYVGGGIFYSKAPYGNEWIINQYFLYKHGTALIGHDFKTLIKPIEITDVKKACVKDLFKEWKPKITDSVYLANSHQQSYIVLNLCRILYTILCNDAVSKSVAALWVEKEYPQWKELIDTANAWEYGKEMNHKDETINFIKFIIAKVKK
ncbi:DUF4111 domain-containing protein [Patescibacteria group bacterium]|nr:DUF4111 domain-containing protein [Patescibacteria group bacterium]MBU4579442.1 DUF4111 domain-containing protein [Patescibacteria group bacterium]